MTYSLIARCPVSGAFGAVVTSSSVATAARCIRTDAMGAVATQNFSDPALGPLGIRLLREGLGAAAVLRLLLDSTTAPEHRQVAVVDRRGALAWHVGEVSMPVAAFATGPGCVAMGNLLANDRVPTAMVDAFVASEGEALAERLMRALEAGLDTGGEFDDEHGAGLLVSETHDWPVVDLRVDWDDAPIAALRALWTRYAPQQAAYVARFLDPRQAPTF
ncbi:DUF1028 domain-containing protein [Roseomonas sp. HJA6]|uniref:DUF1028 domain-containing protein n=1 Tax=Roseomonas alba TaxID=2846776 RepID=A0ABS7AAR8_9PROT|nr:DUF1028 domain-containing protein [Neoroseomonas alba]MBW6399400.1 DUF1028 domain-containing protein [Neoroseomonas alba]